MLKPNVRFFVVPLAAICMLATLATQPVPRLHRDANMIMARQAMTDCSSVNPADVCVIEARN